MRDYLHRATRKRCRRDQASHHEFADRGRAWATSTPARRCFAPASRRGVRRAASPGQESQALVQAIKEVLAEAIEIGGTTLRDYVNAEGTPGYFRTAALRL